MSRPFQVLNKVMSAFYIRCDSYVLYNSNLVNLIGKLLPEFITNVYGIKMHKSVATTFPGMIVGTYEANEVRIFLEILKYLQLIKTHREKVIVVDVGAHYGYYTLLAAKYLGDCGYVYAFEPHPDNFHVLIMNILANKLTNVCAYKKAVMDKEGFIELFISEGNPGGHKVWSDKEKKEVVYTEVLATTLDTFLNEKGEQLDLVKIDVNGAEMNVIMGMDNVLKQNNHLKIIIEFHPYGLMRCGFHPNTLLSRLINRYSFTIFKIGKHLTPIYGDFVNKISSIASRGHFNLLCVKESDADFLTFLENRRLII